MRSRIFALLLVVVMVILAACGIAIERGCHEEAQWKVE